MFAPSNFVSLQHQASSNKTPISKRSQKSTSNSAYDSIFSITGDGMVKNPLVLHDFDSNGRDISFNIDGGPINSFPQSKNDDGDTFRTHVKAANLLSSAVLDIQRNLHSLYVQIKNNTK